MISVSPPPGPFVSLYGASAGADPDGTSCTSRHESPLSTEMFQTDRWVPVPAGPETSTSPGRSVFAGPTLMSGSPYMWIGSTIRGTPKDTFGPVPGFGAPTSSPVEAADVTTSLPV